MYCNKLYFIIIIQIVLVIIVYWYSLTLSICNTNYLKRSLNYEYHIQCIINICISMIIYYIVYFYKDKLFTESIGISIQNIIFYIIIVDTIIFWIHYYSHKILKLKELFHMVHHNTYNILPTDLFYTDFKEYLIYGVIVGVFPILFYKINILDYLIANILIFIHQIYTHSELSFPFYIPGFIHSKYHMKHHKIGKGNYSILLPLWDKYMNTIIKTKKKKKKKKICKKK